MGTWEVINSQEDGPYAVRTKLGWVLTGLTRRSSVLKIGHSFDLPSKNETPILSNNCCIGSLKRKFGRKGTQENKDATAKRLCRVVREPFNGKKISFPITKGQQWKKKWNHTGNIWTRPNESGETKVAELQKEKNQKPEDCKPCLPSLFGTGGNGLKT